MSYHSDFWVAAAAAAPVIGLSHAVLFTQQRYIGDETRARRRAGRRFAYWVIIGRRAPRPHRGRRRLRPILTAAATVGGKRRLRLVRLVLAGLFIALPGLITLAGMYLDLTVLLDSLRSLGSERDRYTTNSIIGALVWSFVLLPTQFMVSVTVYSRVQQLNDERYAAALRATLRRQLE